MTINEIPNITIEEMGEPVRYYRISAAAGYVIKLPEYEENVYKTVAIFTPNYDFSAVKIMTISELPEDIEIM